MREIPLTQGKVALIDDEDFKRVAAFRWHAVRQRHHWYAATAYWDGARMRQVTMHGFIMEAPKGQRVDHEDGDGLNNCRSNLRLATHHQNQMNRRKSLTFRGRATVSKFKGVDLHKPTGRWRARISFNGKHISLGAFATEEQAALAYDVAAVKYFGEFARCNLSGKEIGIEKSLPRNAGILSSLAW